MSDWQLLTQVPNQLAESPFWHSVEQRLYWVDIPAKKICRTDLHSQQFETWQMPSEPGCIAPMQGGGLVLALRSGIYLADGWQSALQHLVTLPYDAAMVRANDGKCDEKGRFWVGTVDESKKHQAAALYCLDYSDGLPRVTCHLRNATTANGLAWSPDQRTMYWADTPQHAVRQWDFDAATGNLGKETEFLHWESKPQDCQLDDVAYQGRPDGAAVDSEGHYFVAMYEGGSIEQYTAQGQFVARHTIPVLCPTMPCFGGKDLRTMFVTTSRHGRSSAELAATLNAGCVFFKQMSTPGLPVNYFSAPK